MHSLRSADETDGGHAVAPLVKGFAGGGGNCGMLREAEVIVRAKVQDRLAVGHTDGGALRRHDDALVFEGAGGADVFELGLYLFYEGTIHS